MEPQHEQQTQSAAPDTAAPELAAQETPSAAPRRRRRAQPPQQITQRMKKISVPEDMPIPQLPVIEETGAKPKKKRYKKAAGKPKDTAAAQARREKAAQQVKAAADVSRKGLKTAGGVLLVLLMALMEGSKRLAVLAKRLASRAKDLIGQRRGGESAAQEEIVLEAIRPEEYHGRGAQHVHEDKRQEKRSAQGRSGLSARRLCLSQR